MSNELTVQNADDFYAQLVQQGDRVGALTARDFEMAATPRLSIAQKGGKLIKLPGVEEGDVLLSTGVPIVKRGETIKFAVLLQYSEATLWARREDIVNGKMVTKPADFPEFFESTTDTKSDGFRRAISRQESEQCVAVEHDGQQWRADWTHHKNYVVLIDGYDAPVIVSFSRGEAKYGTKLSTSITMICGLSKPIYGVNWVARVGMHENNSGQQWLGFDIMPDPAGTWCLDVPTLRKRRDYCIAATEKYSAAQMKSDHSTSSHPDESATTDTGQF